MFYHLVPVNEAILVSKAAPLPKYIRGLHSVFNIELPFRGCSCPRVACHGNVYMIHVNISMAYIDLAEIKEILKAGHKAAREAFRKHRAESDAFAGTDTHVSLDA